MAQTSEHEYLFFMFATDHVFPTQRRRRSKHTNIRNWYLGTVIVVIFFGVPKVSAFVYVYCSQTRLVSDLSIAHRDVSHDAPPRKCLRIARGHPPNSLPVSS